MLREGYSVLDLGGLIGTGPSLTFIKDCVEAVKRTVKFPAGQYRLINVVADRCSQKRLSGVKRVKVPAGQYRLINVVADRCSL